MPGWFTLILILYVCLVIIFVLQWIYSDNDQDKNVAGDAVIALLATAFWLGLGALATIYVGPWLGISIEPLLKFLAFLL